MKKRIIIAGVIILAVVIVLLLLTIAFMYLHDQNILAEKEATIINFSLSDYQEEIKIFSSQKKVGSVTTAEDAIAKAKELWTDIYSEDEVLLAIIQQNPIAVAFDEENSCWRINGTLPHNPLLLGAVPHVLIQSDGTVLAIWVG